jgi:hypothetical protein
MEDHPWVAPIPPGGWLEGLRPPPDPQLTALDALRSTRATVFGNGPSFNERVAASNQRISDARAAGASWSEALGKEMLNPDDPWLSFAMGTAAPFDGALPMDVVSRATRALAGRFHPATWYHGTASDFPAFDPAHLAQGNPLYPGSQGFWFARSPQTADYFARNASGEAPNILPTRLRLGRARQFEWDPNLMNHEVSATLNSLRADGYDSAIIRNYRIGDTPPSDVAVIFQPQNIRSVHAAFDPTRADSPNLLYGLGALSLGAGENEPQ